MNFHPFDSAEKRYEVLKQVGYIEKYSGPSGRYKTELQIELLRRSYYGKDIQVQILEVKGRTRFLIGQLDLSN